MHIIHDIRTLHRTYMYYFVLLIYFVLYSMRTNNVTFCTVLIDAAMHRSRHIGALEQRVHNVMFERFI